ncbi:MAG TPA: nucleoside-diphosphate kinase [Patescibacteria group bacterium]|nr:nucleoside-diphosphate kinase [Patescibacteria group bacterium]
MPNLERTLIVLKPDAIKRGIIGEILSRFEKAGLKIVAMKMVWIDKDLAGKHYDEDLAKRRGEHVRQYNIDFITQGPTVVAVLEGIGAIENVRKMVGDTEPKSAKPGTIRGDYSHVSYDYCNKQGVVTKNIIHASSDTDFASREIALWFAIDEIHDYKRSDEDVMF